MGTRGDKNFVAWFGSPATSRLEGSVSQRVSRSEAGLFVITHSAPPRPPANFCMNVAPVRTY